MTVLAVLVFVLIALPFLIDANQFRPKIESAFFYDKAYPTYLYFNPCRAHKGIHIEVGPKRVEASPKKPYEEEG